MKTVAVVGIGGAIGTCLRAEINDALVGAAGSFPWATFVVNVTGSFVLGVVVVVSVERLGPNRYLRPLLGTGFCGGLTTFSTLAVETDLLIRAGKVALALGYVGLSVVAGIVAVIAGMTTARRRWPSTRG